MDECFLARSNILDSHSMGGGIMDPIAVIHWVDGKGIENMRPCFDQSELNRATREVREKNLMSWTCMCSGDAAIPLRPPERHVRGA